MIDLLASPGTGIKDAVCCINRGSPRGNPKFGPEAWCDIRDFPLLGSLTPDLPDVIPQALFDITGFVKALGH